jgi:hypothetical protein
VAKALGLDPNAGDVIAQTLGMINYDSFQCTKHTAMIGLHYAKTFKKNPKMVMEMLGESITKSLKKTFVDPAKKVAKGTVNVAKKVSGAKKTSAVAMRSGLTSLAESVKNIGDDAANAIEGAANAIESSARKTLNSIRAGVLEQIEHSPMLGANSPRIVPSM